MYVNLFSDFSLCEQKFDDNPFVYNKKNSEVICSQTKVTEVTELKELPTVPKYDCIGFV